MTIIDALSRIDEVKPNGYSQGEKVAWLSTLDGMVKREIIDTHERCGKECCASVDFDGYDAQQDIQTKLLIPEPYADAYLRWLEAQIDYANGEYGKYNNSIAMFNSAYASFANFYNRTHMPIGKKLKFF